MSNKVKSFILGVTGVIGSGKSTFCRILEKKYGFHWIEADKLVHELYKYGNAGYFKIKKYFGSSFVNEKEVDRKKLRHFVLNSPQKLRILNNTIHPLVVHEVNKKIVQLKGLSKSKKQILVCIEAIYFEKEDLGKFIDQLVFVDAPDKAIFKRLKSRKIPPAQLKTLLLLQRKNRVKNGLIINNTTSKKDLVNNVNCFAIKLLT